MNFTMKTMRVLLIAVLLMMGWSCGEYDDSLLSGRVDSLENRVTKLEELCKQMNTNIASMQALIDAVRQNDYITQVSPVMSGGDTVGYTISFAKAPSITIYHGADGRDGVDGVAGADGKDGAVPVIGVRKDDDGMYYWTLNGGWLLDDAGGKIRAEGRDGVDGKPGNDGNDGSDGADGRPGTAGKPGADGKDGVTPQLKIDGGYWYISYDNGASWRQLGPAAGADGADGADGDSFFRSVDTSDSEYVVFTLADGTQIKLPTMAMKLNIRILAAGAIECDHFVVEPGSELELRCETSLGTTLAECDVYVAANGGMSAVFDRVEPAVGIIRIRMGAVVDDYSNVVVIATDGARVAMRSLTFEAGELVISGDDEILVSNAGGVIPLTFLTNLDYTMKTDGYWFIELDDNASRAVKTENITVLENRYESERSAQVVVSDATGAGHRIVWTIRQAASEHYKTMHNALAQIYASLGGEHWFRNDGWNTDAPVKDREGVIIEYMQPTDDYISPNGYRVIGLVLNSNNLSGVIPAEIGDLTDLKRLDLGNNNISGSIPQELGQCEALEALLMNGNMLSGAVPEELGGCMALKEINFSHNRLTSLPESISNWAQVKSLPVSYNELTSIPTGIAGMKSLEGLSAAYNHLREIPSAIYDLKSTLTGISLAHNDIEAEFPEELCSMTKLRVIELADNRIYGRIPDQIRQLAELESLRLGQTFMSGEIPDGLYDCRELVDIALGHANANASGEGYDASWLPGYAGLTGTISSRIGNLVNLKNLNLEDNSLSGEIPAEICRCEALTTLILSGNNLTGQLPDEIGRLSQLIQLWVDNNNLSGDIPDSFYGLTLLRSAILARCAENMWGLDLLGREWRQNHFMGELSDRIGEMTQLFQLLLSGTDMTGTLPATMLSMPSLSEVSLSYNRFTGVLPRGFLSKAWYEEWPQQDGYGLSVAD